MHEDVIPDLLAAFTIARQRSKDWVIQLIDSRGDEIRRFTPNSYLFSVDGGVKDNPYTYWFSSHQGVATAPIYASDQPDGIYINILRDEENDEWIIALQLVTDEEVASLNLPGSIQGSLVSRAALPPELGSWIEIGRYRMEDGRYILTSPFEATVNGQEKRFLNSDEIVNLLFQNYAEVMDLAVAMSPPDDKYVQWSEDALPDTPQENPYSSQTGEVDSEHYRFFHGVPPDEVIEKQAWVPGGMVLIGHGEDVGYGILNRHSSKDGWYVHDFGANVKVYRRARQGEQADKTWSTFPHTLTSLGYNLGFSYIDNNGQLHEVKGSKTKRLSVTPSRKTLVVVGPNGVEYLMEGGDMRVDDWIRD